MACTREWRGRSRCAVVRCRRCAELLRLATSLAVPLCNRQHTTQPVFLCVSSKPAARQFAGRGQLFFPLDLPCAPGARIPNVLVATSLYAYRPSPGFAGANPRRRPPRFSNATVLQGSSSPTVCPACRSADGCPSFEFKTGDPAPYRDVVFDLVHPPSGMRWSAAGVRPASAGLSRATRSSLMRRLGQCTLSYAAAPTRRTRLDAAPSAYWSLRGDAVRCLQAGPVRYR